jgi:hypothetical protein
MIKNTIEVLNAQIVEKQRKVWELREASKALEGEIADLLSQRHNLKAVTTHVFDSHTYKFEYTPGSLRITAAGSHLCTWCDNANNSYKLHVVVSIMYPHDWKAVNFALQEFLRECTLLTAE